MNFIDDGKYIWQDVFKEMKGIYEEEINDKNKSYKEKYELALLIKNFIYDTIHNKLVPNRQVEGVENSIRILCKYVISRVLVDITKIIGELNVKAKEESKKKKQEDALMAGTVVFSVVLAVAIFFALPYFLSGIFHKITQSQMMIALFEGIIRLVIFIGYIAIISMTPDIKRTFMYHGAEHKCINCIEHGMELNVENVRKSSKLHKRCGTSFLLIVMLISILFFMFIRVDSKPLQLLLRLVLIPVIAGVSFEFIRLAGRYDNWFMNILSQPGLWMQRLTTKEPDDDMIEVGIASVEAVFDWKAWQKEEG